MCLVKSKQDENQIEDQNWPIYDDSTMANFLEKEDSDSEHH